MKVLCVFVLLLVAVALVAGQSQPIKNFVATFSASEVQPIAGVPQTRTYGGRLYYSDTWQAGPPQSGNSAIRYDIDLNDGVISTTLTQLAVYQDQFFQYTICHTCAWADIFATEPLPQLYLKGGETPVQTNVNVDGVNTNVYNITQTNVVGVSYPNFVSLYVKSSQPQWVVRAIITDTNTQLVKTLDLASQSTPVPAGFFTVPAGCPDIDPGCFRLDLAFVIDVSGSVGNDGSLAEKQFAIDLVNTFLIGPQALACSLSTFSECSNARVQVPMSFNKNTLLAGMNAANFASGGFTCIVGGIQRGFWTFASANGSRVATPKGMIVATDGNANRPCSPVGVLTNSNEDCEALGSYASCVGNNCAAQNPCDANTCCQLAADCHLTEFYASPNTYALYNPKIYAVGVTNEISDQTLRAIVNDPAALAAGEPRIFRVASWEDVSESIAALALAILCDVPGAESCPNDCRPGGFCCGGSCQCTIDCSIQSTDCQQSVCQANAAGAGCQLGPADNASCVDPAIQCNVRYCKAGTGCQNISDDSLSCTDNNACTIDICSGGLCTTNKNNSVFQCDDHNQCTQDDQCLANGACAGTANDQLNCTDGNPCTTDVCFNGTCISTAVVCTDDTITDCKIPKCDPTTGTCANTFVKPGFACLPPDPKDPCTVFVCTGYDPVQAAKCNPATTTCNFGSCVARTKDTSGCTGSSSNTAAIIGGVVGGVALIIIIILIILALLLFLCRKAVIGVVGNLNPFAASTDVKNAATYVSPVSSDQSGLYEGGL